MKTNFINSFIRQKSILIPLSGFLFCIMLISSVNVAPMMAKKDGYVWSPINSRQFRVGDAYYYAAWMTEVTKGKFPPGHPAAQENAQKHSIEFFKLVPVVLSAFPALLVSDPRYMFSISFTLFPSFLFLLVYVISQNFIKNRWLSFSLGILIVFWYWIWYSPGDSIGSSLRYLVHFPENILNISKLDLEYLNDNFRFVNLSVSSCIVMALMLSFVFLYRRKEWPYFMVSFVLCLAVAFTYIPQMVFCYSLIIGFVFVYLAKGDRKAFWCFFLLGTSVFTTLLSIGYISMLRTFTENTYFISSIFSSKLQNQPSWGTVQKGLLMSKYTFSGAIALMAAWKTSELRDWVIVLIMVGLLFNSISIISQNPEFSIRFFVRAYDQIWLLFVLVSIFAGLEKYAGGIDWQKRRTCRFLLNATGISLIAFITFIPAVGLARYAVRNTQTPAFYIPSGQWDAYRWLSANTKKNSVVLAMDWNDVYLIPAYTHNNLFFGHYILDNRSENEEIRRYLTAWHTLGLPRKDLENLVMQSTNSYNLLDASALGNPNWPSQEVHESALFLHGLIYYPYLISVDGRTVGTPEFTRYILDLYDKLRWRAVMDTIPCDYVLVSKFYWDRAALLSDTQRFHLVYSNETRRIYQLIPASDNMARTKK